MPAQYMRLPEQMFSSKATLGPAVHPQISSCAAGPLAVALAVALAGALAVPLAAPAVVVPTLV